MFNGLKPTVMGTRGVLLGQECNGNAAAEIASNTSGLAYIDFTQINADFRGRIVYNNSTNSMTFHSAGNATARMTVQSDGVVNIPTLTGTKVI